MDKNEERKGFLDSIKDLLPSAKRLQEAETRAQEAENKVKDLETRAQEAETRAQEAETRAQELEAQLKALQEEFERAKAEARKSPEEKRNDRTTEVFAKIQDKRSNKDFFYNLDKVFHKNLGVANEYLDDPKIVAAIIKKYPESIANVPNNLLAANFEEFTSSFITGVTEICTNPEKEGYRTNQVPMKKDENNKDIPFDKDHYISSVLFDMKHTFTEKMSTLCSEATNIVEANQGLPNNPYENINPRDLQLAAYLQLQYEEDDSVIAKAAKTMNHRKDEAKLAAEVIAKETEME